MGDIYYKSQGTLQSLSCRSFKYYKLAADQGIQMLSQVGDMYYNGQGTPTNHSLQIVQKLSSINKLAADQGHTGAQLNVGYMYYKGLGIQRNL